MALAPALLRRRLIGSVVGVGGELLALPAAPTRALTLGAGAITLMGNMAPRLERASAADTAPLCHGLPP
jgi:hypothetical protein